MPDNNVLLMRRLSDEGSIVMHTRVGGVWAEDQAFPGAAYSYAKSFVDGAGCIHIAAVDAAGGVSYLRKPPTSTWESVSVAGGAPPGRAPGIAVTSDGKVLVVFVRGQDQKLVLLTGSSATQVQLSLNPKTLKLSSNGNFVTAYLTAGTPEGAVLINGSSVAISQVNGATIPPLHALASSLQDQDGDGILETMMVKFSRSALTATLQPGTDTVTVTGSFIGGGTFAASDTLRAMP